MIKVEQYQVCIITLEVHKTYDNPFLDCIIQATFTGPNKQVIIREAYWDGGNVYRIAFAPTQIGMWSYSLKAPRESGVDSQCGTLECISYRGTYEIYKHGFLQVSEDKRYFTYADGTPFFWLGDTHWEFAYKERWDESNHPQMDSMFKGMVDRRVEQGYTIYQTNLRSDALMHGEAKYWSAQNLPNIKFYQEELDRRMYYIANHGIVNALGLAWFMSIEDNIEQYQQLARYIIARYGALPIVWTLAGEVAGYEPKKRDVYINGWREVAAYIHKKDGYHHLQTAHYTNERPFASYYQDEDWLDFTLNQAGHGDYVVSVEDYKDFMKLHGDKPFVEGECFYEFCSTLEENGPRLCSDAMLRRVAYMSMQVGACGYTYGAQGIWDNVWEKGQENTMQVFNRYDITWVEGIDGVGGYQMGYMKLFYEEQKFWELYPYSQEDDAQGNPFGKKLPFISTTKDKKRLVFYYSESTRKTATITGLQNGKYEMKWFNPRTGQYEKEETITIEHFIFKIPTKLDTQDWCLVVCKQ